MIEDTMLIKINQSYREGMLPEELYNATSVSWVISKNKLEEGNIKYYCAVYSNIIKEVYELTGYESDKTPGKESRFILHGKLATDEIRNALIGLNVQEIHKGAGNPIKYTTLDKLYELAKVTNNKQEEVENNKNYLLKFLLQLLKENSIIYTYKRRKPNKVTEIDDNGIYIESESSRNKYEEGQIERPDQFYPIELLENAFTQFLKEKGISKNDLQQFGHRSSFLFALFSQLPFVDIIKTSEYSYLKMKSFTTTDLPGQFNNSIKIALDKVENKKEIILEAPFIKMIYDMLILMDGMDAFIKRKTLIETMFNTVVSSTTETPITESVANRKLSDTLILLKELNLIDENLNIIQQELSIEKREILPEDLLIEHIHLYIKNKGFYSSKEQILNLFLSLRTKPFVILSGISGTGKTKIVQLFAESLGATTENGQFTLIPVRPDWSDGSDLIGYEDLQGNFQPGPLTKVLKEANQPENQDKPYFILLDEMNLARVEYYFSDILSIMETKRIENDLVKSDPIIDREETGTLMLQDNVYIIGTVNMDETTHPFSKKVLDRANTIEYNEVNLDYFDFLQDHETLDPIPIANNQLASKYIHLKDAYTGNEEIIHQVTSWLVEINSYLEKIQSHFAYRVRDEICFYMIYNEEAGLMDREKAFDLQILQKILPRIMGNDLTTDNVLKKLFEFCTNHSWEETLEINTVINEARFPKSAKKIANMIRKIETEGFTSFWMG